MGIRQKKRILGTTIIAAAAVVAAVVWWQQRPEVRAASMTPPFSAGVPWHKPPDNKNGSAIPARKSVPVTAPPTSIWKRMWTTKDWYALAKENLQRAKAGDPEAQFVLYVTHRRCYHQYPPERVKPDSEQAVREEMTSFGLPAQAADNAALWFNRCHGFWRDADANSFGDPWDWLQKATDAGYPPAQATTAQERLMQDQFKADVRAGERPDDPTPYLPPIGGDAEPRDLLVLAAQSADPDVLGQISNLQNMLNPAQPKDVININTAAWEYVACQRGMDCSSYGPGTVFNCGPNDGNCVGVPDWVLKLVNYNWAPVQEKVNQINAVLNSKQWDQLPDLIAGG